MAFTKSSRKAAVSVLMMENVDGIILKVSNKTLSCATAIFFIRRLEVGAWKGACALLVKAEDKSKKKSNMRLTSFNKQVFQEA